MKKKNAKDATIRNVKASNRRDYLLLLRIEALEVAVEALVKRLNIIEGRETLKDLL